LEQRIRELCEILLATEDEAVFHAAAEELRQTLHQHIEDLRDQTHQLEIANRLLKPTADSLVSPTQNTPSDLSNQPKPEPSGLPKTVVLQLPSKPKRKPRRPPPAA
jgi:hypothetical protein